ncbi:MAG: signal peptide peptidase SppA [Verrucomicrobiae bacterium]|nr:signal peptide peptidase SppA [Verrucomicrobiae bacterium]
MTAMQTPSPTPPKRTGWIIYSVIATCLLLLSWLVCLTLFALWIAEGSLRNVGKRHHYFEEIFVQGDTDTRNKIAVIYLSGLISSDYAGIVSEEGMVGDIKAQLDQAVQDKHVKAIILRINSPGGEVVASDALYNALAEVRDQHQKPIVASMDSIAASGAYYVAMGASYIIASDLTLTGSIGVIMQTFGFSGLMDKIGVKSHTFKSGKYKDLLNPTREPTDDEKAMVNTLIMEVYDKFVGIVATERKLDARELKSSLADGRVLSGAQALRGKLVDQLGYFDDAVEKAKELANIKKAKVITYQAPFSLGRFLRFFFAETPNRNLQVNLGAPLPKLQPGKLYYLPPYLFQ